MFMSVILKTKLHKIFIFKEIFKKQASVLATEMQ